MEVYVLCLMNESNEILKPFRVFHDMDDVGRFLRHRRMTKPHSEENFRAFPVMTGDNDFAYIDEAEKISY